MARDNRLLSQLRHVPEALFGHVAHVDEYAERLCALKKAFAFFRQPFIRAARRGKAVREIPHKGDHPHALLTRKLQKPFVLTHGLRALNGEKRRAFSRPHGGFSLGCRAAERDPVRVFAQLRVKVVQRTGENFRPRQLRLDPGGAEREKLRPCAKPLRAFERNGQRVFPQRLVLQPELDGRVAVAVKNAVLRQNASSIWVICGRRVCMPSGA